MATNKFGAFEIPNVPRKIFSFYIYLMQFPFFVVFLIQTNKSKIKFHNFYISEYTINTYLFANVMLRPDTGS